VRISNSCDDVCSETPKRPAAFSIGRAKTFITDYHLLIEAHLLEKNVEDLRGKWLAMDFIERIRGQKRFANETELAVQIAADCEAAKKNLSSSP
jgi:riboflavin kinase/FMN adenylyltransferase